MPEGISIRVTPRASRVRWGMRGDQITFSTPAPPVDGAANRSLTDAVKELLRVPQASIALVRGHTSREKVVEIEGWTAGQFRTHLAQHLGILPLDDRADGH